MHGREIDKQLTTAFFAIDECQINPLTGRRMNEPTKRRLFRFFEFLTKIQTMNGYTFKADKKYNGHTINVREGEIRLSWERLAGRASVEIEPMSERTVMNYIFILQELGLLYKFHQYNGRDISMPMHTFKVIRLRTFSEKELIEADEAVTELIESVNKTVKSEAESALSEITEQRIECTENSTFAEPSCSSSPPQLVNNNILESNYHVCTGCTESLKSQVSLVAFADKWQYEGCDGGVNVPRVPVYGVPDEADGEYYATWVGQRGSQYYARWVIWDVDADDAEIALVRTRNFVSKLRSFGVQDEAIRVVFSTRRGFHVYLDSRVVGLKPDADLHSRLKNFAVKLLPECDPSLYAKRHIIGIPNSKHRITGLYYTPLTLDELFEFGISQMRKHAERPHEFAERSDAVCVVDFLQKMFYEAEKKFLSSRLVLESSKRVPREFNGVQKGERDVSLFRLAVRYKGMGLSAEEAYELLSVANSRNTPPLPREVVKSKIKNVFGL